jgi:hypothetical protein
VNTFARRFLRQCLLSSLLLCCGCAARTQPGSLEYQVDFKGAATGQVEVTLLTKGFPVEFLIGRKTMDVEKVEARNRDGASVPVEHLNSEVGENVNISGRDISSLSYTVKVGKAWVYPTVGKDMGRRFGSLDSRFGVISGSNLFLLPENYSDLQSVGIKFLNIPDGLQLVTTLQERDGAYTVDAQQGNKLLAEYLHGSLIAVGRFRQRSEKVNDTLVKAYFEESLEGDPDSILTKIVAGHEYLGKRMGDLQKEYTYIFVPQTSDAKKVELDASPLGQAQSVLHWTKSLWARINYNLAEAYTRFRPLGYLYKPTDIWFSEGVTSYITLLLMENAGLADLPSEMIDTYDRYFIDPRITSADLKAIERNSNPFPHKDKAVILTYLLDRRLKEGGRNIFSLLKEISRNGRVVDLKENISAVAGARLSDLYESYMSDPDKMIQPSDLALDFPQVQALSGENVEEVFTDELSPSLIKGGGQNNGTCRIVVSGITHSYLENCGCKKSQNGGVSRRLTAINELRKGAGDFLLVDAGDFFPDEKQAPYLDPLVVGELDTNMAAMEKMGYDAAAVGFSELRYSYDFLKERMKNVKLPLVNCNVQTAEGKAIAAPYVTKKVGGSRATIIGAWEYKAPEEYVSFYDDATYGLAITDPVEAVAQTVSKVKADDAMLVVVGNVSPHTARRMIDRCPDIDVLITSRNHFIDYDSVPERGDLNLSLRLYKEDKSGFYKNSLILYANMDTFGISAADLRTSQGRTVDRAQVYRLALSSKVEEHPQIRALLDNYYNSIQSDPSMRAKPLFKWDKSLDNNQYVGVQSCRECHQEEYDHWKTTKHFGAFKTLVISRRQSYPKCAVCHVTGYGYEPGFMTSKDEVRFGGVQCEICHGPGKTHALAPSEGNIRRSPPQAVCLECHTPEHSNKFVFDQRIAMVRHKLNNDAGGKE